MGTSNVTTNGDLTISGSTGLDLKSDSGNIQIDGSSVTVNEPGADSDFRVETSNKPYAIFADGGTDQVLILSGGAVASYNEATGADVNFYVSGSVGSRGNSVRGASVFGGDLVTSGNLHVYTDSSSTDTRTLAKIHNDNASATATTLLHLVQDGGTAAQDAAAIIESTLATTSAELVLRASAADHGTGLNATSVLTFHRPDTTNEQDDMRVGGITFNAMDSIGAETSYALIQAYATDVTHGDEGGLIKFSVSAGGTAGAASGRELLTIGGEDVANATPVRCRCQRRWHRLRF